MTTEQTDPFAEKLSHLKQTEPVCAEETTPYGEVLRILRERKSGFIVICRDRTVKGLFSARDFVAKCVLEGTDPGTPISELMTRDPATVRSDATVGEAAALMREKGVSCLPIVDEEGRLTGLLSVGTLLRYLAYMFAAEVVNLPPRPKQIGGEAEGA
ncbi:MAG: CBS domain-containing protein [Elusimicrobiota bacterium]